jgi:hypothetical protein
MLGEWVSDAEVAETRLHTVPARQEPGGHDLADRPPVRDLYERAGAE